MKTIKFGIFFLAFYLKKIESSLNLRPFSKNSEISDQPAINKIKPDNLTLFQLETNKKGGISTSSDSKCCPTTKKDSKKSVEINLN